MTHASSGEMDVVEILTRDHREMTDLLAQAENTSDATQRRNLVDTVIAEIMRHAVAEEMYVYPAIKQHVPDGAKAVQHDKREHQEIVELMKQLESMEPSSPAFMTLVGRLDSAIRHHAEDEEGEQFPKLRANLSREVLLDVGRQVERAKQLAPTRPHPTAPHSEIFHKTVGPGVGMVDRLRDKLTGRHTG